MVLTCVAFGCKSRKNTDPLLSFYRFPADSERCKKWEVAVRREGWKSSKNSRLCSTHFTAGKA